MTEKHLVIYDTDPGVDDAMALYFALAHPAMEVLGITTVFGNVTVEQATTNALYLTQLTGRDIPVVQGAGAPLVKPFHAPPAHIHGADGLGNLPSRGGTQRSAQAGDAAQFIVNAARARPGQITLVPVGPLTNIARALQLEPRLPQLIKQVVLMGGTVQEMGNVSPVAEANIWSDPHAADAVFTAGFNLTMVGLDVTHQIVLPVSLFEKFSLHHRHEATDALLHAARFYAGFYTDRFAHIEGFSGCFGHDVLAFVRLAHPELFGHASGQMRVVLEGITHGQTVMRRDGQMAFLQPGWEDHLPQSQACLTVNAAAATAAFEQTLLRPWL
jgi:inosine-uridine nucleoside N-ribohydrolase